MEEYRAQQAEKFRKRKFKESTAKNDDNKRTKVNVLNSKVEAIIDLVQSSDEEGEEANQLGHWHLELMNHVD